jgi:osmotically-inducible protein OsmY
MKTPKYGLFALALVGALAALPLQAARDTQRIDSMVLPSNTVHTGAETLDDHQLASDVVAAISADRSLSGSSMTVVVKNGRITLSGSAKDAAQAARAEKVASDLAGGRPVDSRLDIQGG